MESNKAVKDKKLFMTDKGNYLTQSLFLELGYHSAAMYSLTSEHDKEYKGKMYPSLKQIYMEYAYPGGLKGEYEFALHAFYSWKQWCRICDNALISPTIADWRDEIEFKANSGAMRVLIDEVVSGGTAAVSTSKWMMDRGYVDKTPKGKVSRKTKENKIKHDAKIKGVYQEDLDRMSKASH